VETIHHITCFWRGRRHASSTKLRIYCSSHFDHCMASVGWRCMHACEADVSNSTRSKMRLHPHTHTHNTRMHARHDAAPHINGCRVAIRKKLHATATRTHGNGHQPCTMHRHHRPVNCEPLKFSIFARETDESDMAPTYIHTQRTDRHEQTKRSADNLNIKLKPPHVDGLLPWHAIYGNWH
jgi:hypothetical protein